MDPSWYLYLGIFVGPFVQEDAAVLAAATLSAADPRHFPIVFIVILAGLFVSDIWKYWIGYAAHAHPSARKFAEKDRVIRMKKRVKTRLWATLLAARFVPLARVPAYVACGYFKVNYVKFCAIIAVTALLYTSAVFAIIHLLGKVFADKIEMMLPAFGIGVLVILVTVHFGRQLWKKSYNSP